MSAEFIGKVQHNIDIELLLRNDYLHGGLKLSEYPQELVYQAVAWHYHKGVCPRDTHRVFASSKHSCVV